MMQVKILEFIKRRFPENNGNWNEGNCFWFALILKTRFDKGEIWYEPIRGHFIFKFGVYFYDWTGIYKEDTSKAFKFERENDELLYDRLIRNCVL